jgi:hypothetical protein
MSTTQQPDPASAFVPLHETVDSCFGLDREERPRHLKLSAPDPERERAVLRSQFYRDAVAVHDATCQLLYLVEAFERRNDEAALPRAMEAAGHGPLLTYQEAREAHVALKTIAFLRHALYMANEQLCSLVRVELADENNEPEERPVIAKPK